MLNYSYYFASFTAFPLFLHSLTSLVTNCLCLLFGKAYETEAFFYKQEGGGSHCGTAETSPTRNHEIAGSIPGLAQWIKDLVLL